MKTILILASNPRGDLRIDREIRDLTAAIERSKNAKEFAVIDKLAVRPGDLQDIFSRNHPYIVHFCGHGAGERGLVFENDSSGEQLVSNQALSGLFNLFGRDVECVLLNACKTGIQADAIGKHVPYVVGTSREILDRAAYFFAVGFYQALGSGDSIEVSFAKGCNAVELELPNVRIVCKIAKTWRKFVVETAQSSSTTEPLKIILSKNSRLDNPDLPTKISSEFQQTIHAEAKRKKYYDNLRDILDNFGQNRIKREKPISKFEYEQRQTFLNKVREFWIEGFLRPSLYFNTAVDKNSNDNSQILRPLNNLEVIPVDIDRSYDELKQTNIIGQIGDGKTLLILGNPGSGKTIALLQLAERLVKLTQQDLTRPMPVVFNLSSWGEKQPPLEPWLMEELKDKYQVPKTWSEPWLKQQQLVLLLDGLDEVQENHRDACVRAINKFVAEHLETEVVVCSRVKDYEALTERLLLSSAVCIQPLSKQQLSDFLKNADDSLLGLKTVIECDREIAEFAQTPLILNMMTWTYQGWSAEQCRKQFRIAKDRERNLFESYIEKNLERENREEKYPTHKVLHWLSWLATTMVNESKIIFLIEKMQPTLLANRSEKRWYRISSFILAGGCIGLVIGLTNGLIVGLIYRLSDGLIYGLTYGLGFGLIVGLIGGAIVRLTPKIKLFEQMSWSWQKAKFKVFQNVLIFGLMFGLMFGLIIGLIYGLIIGLSVSLNISLSVSLSSALSAILRSALNFGLIGGLIGVANSGISSTEVKQRTIPNQGVWSSGKNSIKMGLIFGLILELSFGLVFGLFEGLVVGLIFGLIGVFIFGLLNGGTTCIQHFNLRQILHRKGRIPWNYARFLDYASERLLMKKVGGGYIFYHRMLMEHFAQRHQVSTEPDRKTKNNRT